VKKTLLMTVMLAISANAAAADFNGTWQLQDANDKQAKLDEAVESVAKEMNFFIRALARPALKKQTQICTQWRLQTVDNQFQWQCDGDDALVIPISAQNEFLRKDEEGVEISGTFQRSDDAITTILQSERGIRTNTWKMVGDNELSYRVKLESEKLPKPMTWMLSYKRE